MRILSKVLAAAAFVAVSATTAHAVTFATATVDYNQGAGITDASRTITTNAVGATDGNFLSLGLGGSAVFSFGSAFTGPAAVIEVTNGIRSGHYETAMVWGGTGYDIGTDTLIGAVLLGTINNTNSVATVAFNGIFSFLKIWDTSPVVAGRDGFDIDSISVAAVPLPAGIALLGAGLAGLGAMGWRKKRSDRLAAKA